MQSHFEFDRLSTKVVQVVVRTVFTDTCSNVQTTVFLCHQSMAVVLGIQLVATLLPYDNSLARSVRIVVPMTVLAI